MFFAACPQWWGGLEKTVALRSGASAERRSFARSAKFFSKFPLFHNGAESRFDPIFQKTDPPKLADFGQTRYLGSSGARVSLYVLSGFQNVKKFAAHGIISGWKKYYFWVKKVSFLGQEQVPTTTLIHAFWSLAG